jgi:hypothetical protein
MMFSNWHRELPLDLSMSAFTQSGHSASGSYAPFPDTEGSQAITQYRTFVHSLVNPRPQRQKTASA